MFSRTEPRNTQASSPTKATRPPIVKLPVAEILYISPRHARRSDDLPLPTWPQTITSSPLLADRVMSLRSAEPSVSVVFFSAAKRVSFSSSLLVESRALLSVVSA